MSRQSLAILVISLLLVTPTSAIATDVVNMKNGDVYRGEIIEQELNSFIQLRMRDGNEKRLDWNNVKSVKKEESSPAPSPEQHTTSSKDTISDGSSLITGGWVMFGGTYLITAIVCAATCTKSANYSYIPLVGPFIQSAHVNSSAFVALNILSGVAQFTGLTLATIGHVQGSQYHRARMAKIEPFFGPEGNGIVLSMHF